VRVRVLACIHARTCARACVFASCMHARVSMCDSPTHVRKEVKGRKEGGMGEGWAEEEQG
jgi:hypothetical protein